MTFFKQKKILTLEGRFEYVQGIAHDKKLKQ